MKRFMVVNKGEKMDITHRIFFNVNRCPEIKTVISFFDQNKIPYEITVLGNLVADVLESDPNWPTISEFDKEFRIIAYSRMLYTEKECADAEWLEIRSIWHFDYPQPVDDYGYESITYSNEHYCNKCGSGLYQKDCFRAKRSPKWGKRGFLMMNWIPDELFVSEQVKTLLEQNSISGVSFWEVKNKSGKETLNDFYQLYIEKTLEPAITKDSTRIEGVSICPVCNKPKHMLALTGQLVYRREAFDQAPDFVKTAEYFGNDNMYYVKEIFVNQKVYQFIKALGFMRSLEFEPIVLV